MEKGIEFFNSVAERSHLTGERNTQRNYLVEKRSASENYQNYGIFRQIPSVASAI